MIPPPPVAPGITNSILLLCKSSFGATSPVLGLSPAAKQLFQQERLWIRSCGRCGDGICESSLSFFKRFLYYDKVNVKDLPSRNHLQKRSTYSQNPNDPDVAGAGDDQQANETDTQRPDWTVRSRRGAVETDGTALVPGCLSLIDSIQRLQRKPRISEILTTDRRKFRKATARDGGLVEARSNCGSKTSYAFHPLAIDHTIVLGPVWYTMSTWQTDVCARSLRDPGSSRNSQGEHSGTPGKQCCWGPLCNFICAADGDDPQMGGRRNGMMRSIDRRRILQRLAASDDSELFLLFFIVLGWLSRCGTLKGIFGVSLGH
ncbi:hypothetical protein GCK32_004048 [Trichostrongylus colubriformis]|uniref:Uncharacterized protein n=1 Tax=Trichostrongylus colubriformis TaxID=6319 RepID=A0AAN8FXA8_TRICO